MVRAKDERWLRASVQSGSAQLHAGVATATGVAEPHLGHKDDAHSADQGAEALGPAKRLLVQLCRCRYCGKAVRWRGNHDTPAPGYIQPTRHGVAQTARTTRASTTTIAGDVNRMTLADAIGKCSRAMSGQARGPGAASEHRRAC